MSKTAKDEYSISDDELVQRSKDGEQRAFDMLVERYLGRAYQIAYGVLGSKEDAEEVAQDVFVRIHRALPKFRGDAEFTTWMYRIAVNLARNKYRWNKSRGSQKTRSIDQPLGNDDENGKGLDLPSENLGPGEQVELDEFKNNIQDELENLPPLYREVLILRNIDDMSYEEIASLLNCKLGTIKSRIARAREELRKRLEL